MAIAGRRTRAIFDRYNITSERDLREAMQRTQEHLNRPNTSPSVVIVPIVVPQGGQGMER